MEYYVLFAAIAGIPTGLLLGAVPAIYGAARDRLGIGIFAWATCIAAGAFGSFLAVVPLASSWVHAIYRDYEHDDQSWITGLNIASLAIIILFLVVTLCVVLLMDPRVFSPHYWFKEFDQSFSG